MSNRIAASQLVHIDDVEKLDVLGPFLQIVISPDRVANTPSILKGTIPAGVVIPLHSHDDVEIFIPISGEIEALRVDSSQHGWVTIGVGDVFHIPAGVKHAFRNSSSAPYVAIIVTTKRLADFFALVGKKVSDDQKITPSHERLESFFAASQHYGYWIGSPEENAAIGLKLELQAG